MQILYKTVTANTQVCAGECYLVGVELSDGGAADTVLIVYDEPDATGTAARKVVTLSNTDEQQDVSRMFPLPGIKCTGLYADWTAGVGTVYYYY